MLLALLYDINIQVKQVILGPKCPLLYSSSLGATALGEPWPP
jgi:hypothetical protein